MGSAMLAPCPSAVGVEMYTRIVGPDSYAHYDTRIITNKPAIGLILGCPGFFRLGVCSTRSC